MKEVWKDIAGYEGLYRVSNFGVVRSLPRATTSGRVLRQMADKDGYMKVSLSKNNKLKRCSVHRLVAMAFIPNPQGLPVVNHKDENKANNIVENLEWCTVAYNTAYKGGLERRGNKRRVPVNQYTLDGIFVQRWSCALNAAKALGISRGNIVSCCTGKRNKTGGFAWKYSALVEEWK